MKSMFKKTVALAVSGVLLMAALTGCTGGTQANTDKEKVSLKLWGSQEDQVMLQGMIDTFKEAYPDKEYDISLGVVGEPDAVARFLEDPAAAADVFAFPNDQLYDLTNAGALYEITLNKDAIIAANASGAVEAASIGDSLFAYPMTADNGYFLYYDSSVISEEQAQSIDGILEACAAANKKFFFDLSNGWYIASFFLGAGGTLDVVDGKQVCDFNNANGLKAGEAIKALAASPQFVTGDDSILKGGIGDTIAAGVSGTWNAADIESILGENYAATKLPTATMGGSQVQLASFAGFKLIGVSSQTQNPVDAMRLAEWLTNEQNQVIRFEKRAMGPSNINAASNPAVQANKALAALAYQGQFAVSQKNVLGSYWTPAEAFGNAMETKDYSKSLQQQLDDMVMYITE